MKINTTNCIISLAICWLGCCASAAADEFVIKIKDAEVGLHRSADYESEIIHTATAGDIFIAVTMVKDFYLVKEVESGNFLYVSFYDAVELTDTLPENVYISGQMPMPEQQDLSYWQVSSFTEERHTERRDGSEGGMLTAHNGKKYPASYDYNDHYKPRLEGEQIALDAMEFLGVTYVLGGTSQTGIDCSGLTLVCLANQGIDVLHRSSLQALHGKYVHYENLEVGDIVFFRDDHDIKYLSHVGIYLGRSKFIHASQSMGKVVIGSLHSTYFRSHYGFARRY